MNEKCNLEQKRRRLTFAHCYANILLRNSPLVSTLIKQKVFMKITRQMTTMKTHKLCEGGVDNNDVEEKKEKVI
jgi:hypothetical protein